MPVASVDEARALAARTTGALEATIERASSSFDEDELQHGVNDEWSTVESMRHVVLVIDLWLSKTILGADDPFDPIALPPTFMPPKLPGTSIDPDARPSFDEASVVLRGRIETVRNAADALTADDLGRPVANHAKTVGGALNVLFSELGAHNHFMNRDLDLIEAGRTTTTA